MTRTWTAAVLAACGVAAVGIGGALAARHDEAAAPCRATAETEVPQPSAEQLAAAGLAELPVAPESSRVDLVAPPFSRSTEVTNPLFPISGLRSAILNGTVDGERFKTETTLLPGTRIMEWSDGRCVEVLVSQYVAFGGGRIHEVALDLYAQADDGSAWYLGEDVFNYEDGVVADLAGSWLAGIDGPAAMIMPADPEAGQVYRPENIAGLVFEEVTVERVGQTVAGPHGPVSGAITVRELHDDGSTERKVFAPGYGEFFTAGGGDVEALALAVPTDARPGGVPPELETMAAPADPARVAEAWKAYRRSGEVPRRLVGPTDAAVRAFVRTGSPQARVDLVQAALDLQLQYRPAAEVDRGRFDAWLRQLLVDAAAEEHGDVLGDVATLEWIRDRIERTLDGGALARLDTLLKELRSAAADEDDDAVAETVRELRGLVR